MQKKHCGRAFPTLRWGSEVEGQVVKTRRAAHTRVAWVSSCNTDSAGGFLVAEMAAFAPNAFNDLQGRSGACKVHRAARIADTQVQLTETGFVGN